MLHNDTAKEMHQQSDFPHNSAAKQIVVNKLVSKVRVSEKETNIKHF